MCRLHFIFLKLIHEEKSAEIWCMPCLL
uniref:Uncharacterized protein n=1 Tax=Arundo donax TaxID=35708 RepID=A0A0A8YVD4_ARUDO